VAKKQENVIVVANTLFIYLLIFVLTEHSFIDTQWFSEITEYS
jgi:hypothetical protein